MMGKWSPWDPQDAQGHGCGGLEFGSEAPASQPLAVFTGCHADSDEVCGHLSAIHRNESLIPSR